VLDRVHRISPLGSVGKVLDVGCGKGTFLRAFSEFRPEWRLFGYELSRKNEQVLTQIPNFESLYTGPIAGLPGGVDVISLIHTLEHIQKPIETLQELAPKVATDGIIIVEVPNAGATPFDLLVADHASHFTRVDLKKLFMRAGLAPLVIADDWMAKELSLVAARGNVSSVPAEPSSATVVHATVIRRLEWLNKLLGDAVKAAQAASTFGIFGTSVAAMWLFGVLGDKVDFFVDEDPGRIGDLHGRPVISPDHIPKHATVYLTLIPEVAYAVAARIKRTDITLQQPPPVA
jgi:SAM-dependent methyltransferase